MAHIPPDPPQASQSNGEPPNADSATAQPGELTAPEDVSAADFAASFGETLECTLDLDIWERGVNSW